MVVEAASRTAGARGAKRGERDEGGNEEPEAKFPETLDGAASPVNHF